MVVEKMRLLLENRLAKVEALYILTIRSTRLG